LKAEEMRDLCNWVRSCANSLNGCLSHERPREAATLARAVAELASATLVRRNQILLDRQAFLLEWGNQLLREQAARSEAVEPVAADEADADQRGPWLHCKKKRLRTLPPRPSRRTMHPSTNTTTATATPAPPSDTRTA